MVMERRGGGYQGLFNESLQEILLYPEPGYMYHS